MATADCCRWEGGEPGHAPSTLFAGAFDSHYSNPAGFCWDINCVDDPINDDPSIEGYNVDEVLQFRSHRCRAGVTVYCGAAERGNCAIAASVCCQTH